MNWQEMFMPSAPIWELMLRGTILYLAIFVLMRVVGRRESGQLNTADLILVLLISEAASAGVTGEAHSIFDSLILVATIMGWSVVLDAVAYHWQWAARILKAPPRALIKDGELNLQTARRELLTRAEVRSELRKQGIDDIAKVYRAYVEPNGMISLIERPRDSA